MNIKFNKAYWWPSQEVCRAEMEKRIAPKPRRTRFDEKMGDAVLGTVEGAVNWVSVILLILLVGAIL